MSNPGSYKSVFLVGMDDDHAPKWYAPKPPVAESVPAPAGLQDTPVGGAVKLGVNHGPGRVRIFALFSDKPVRTPGEVRRALNYVLNNQALHLRREGHALPPSYRDPCSSTAAPARTWLLRIGWRRSRAGPAWDERIPL